MCGFKDTENHGCPPRAVSIACILIFVNNHFCLKSLCSNECLDVLQKRFPRVVVMLNRHPDSCKSKSENRPMGNVEQVDGLQDLRMVGNDLATHIEEKSRAKVFVICRLRIKEIGFVLLVVGKRQETAMMTRNASAQMKLRNRRIGFNDEKIVRV